MSDVTIYTDGASRGNPGPSAVAYVIEGIADEKLTFCQKTGVLPNNQAEYRALIAALDKLLEVSPNDRMLNFFSDSELMVKQIKGEYRVKNAGIAPLYQAVTESLRRLERLGNRYIFTAIPRAQNREADRLCNQALDEV